MSKLGNYLKQIREKKGKGKKGYWSVRAVAIRANISNAYLSQLETGQADKPSPDVLRALANALEHPYEDLMVQAGYLDPTSAWKYLNLSPAAIEALQDPVAYGLLISANKNTKEVKAVLESLSDKIPKMDLQKLEAILQLV